jgi:hypothetical protein
MTTLLTLANPPYRSKIVLLTLIVLLLTDRSIFYSGSDCRANRVSAHLNRCRRILFIIRFRHLAQEDNTHSRDYTALFGNNRAVIRAMGVMCEALN